MTDNRLSSQAVGPVGSLSVRIGVAAQVLASEQLPARSAHLFCTYESDKCRNK